MGWYPWIMILLGILFVLNIWWMIAGHIGANKRLAIINRWSFCGDQYLASIEFDGISYKQHCWRVFTFRSAKPLYGPITQGIWNHSIGSQYDEFWWRCYKEIYLQEHYRTREAINRMMARDGFTLYMALVAHGLDPFELLPGLAPAATKFAMTDGAEEYEQIMAAQELMP